MGGVHGEEIATEARRARGRTEEASCLPPCDARCGGVGRALTRARGGGRIVADTSHACSPVACVCHDSPSSPGGPQGRLPTPDHRGIPVAPCLRVEALSVFSAQLRCQHYRGDHVSTADRVSPRLESGREFRSFRSEPSSRHRIQSTDDRPWFQRERCVADFNKDGPPRHPVRRVLVRGARLDEAQDSRYRVQRQLHRQLQRSSGRRRRRWLHRHHSDRVLRTPDCLAEESGWDGEGLDRGRDRCGRSYRVRLSRRSQQ